MGRHYNETLMRAWSPKEDCHPEIVIGESALMRTQCGAQPPRSLCARPSSVLPSLSPAGPLQLGTHPAPRGAPPPPAPKTPRARWGERRLAGRLHPRWTRCGRLHNDLEPCISRGKHWCPHPLFLKTAADFSAFKITHPTLAYQVD